MSAPEDAKTRVLEHLGFKPGDPRRAPLLDLLDELDVIVRRSELEAQAKRLQRKAETIAVNGHPAVTGLRVAGTFLALRLERLAGRVTLRDAEAPGE